MTNKNKSEIYLVNLTPEDILMIKASWKYLGVIVPLDLKRHIQEKLPKIIS